MKTVDFIFDFASPNAYMSHQLLPDIADRTSAKINYIPCLLGGIFKATGNQAPMITFGPVKGKLEYQRIEMQRFIERHELTKFAMNPHFPVNTLIMMRAAIVAEQDGRLEDYIEVGLLAMWEDGKKMDDPEVFVDVMTKAGFDGAFLLERTQDRAVKTQLAVNTALAVERGAFGVPTFYVGGEMFFGKDRLDLVEEALA